MTVNELTELVVEYGDLVEVARQTSRSGEILSVLEGLKEEYFNAVQNIRGQTDRQDTIENLDDQVAYLREQIARVSRYHYSTGTPPLTPGGSYVGRMGATI